ncbi:TPA: protein rep [Vibrio vulnificus]
MRDFNFHSSLKDTGEVLDDKKLGVTKGEERVETCAFTLRKKQSQAIASAFTSLGMEKKGEYIRDCGGLLGFKECPSGHFKKLSYANFCGQRLCPMCQWRRSLKTFGQVSQIYNVISSRYNERSYSAVMLTLTIKNCGYGELEKTVSNLTKSFNRLFDCKKKNLPFKVAGYFRALEVTYNKKQDNFHPHIHALLLVNQSDYNKYFALKEKRIFETQDIIAFNWARLLKVERAFVHLQRMKNSELKMIAEVAKYATKPSSYIEKDSQGEYFVRNKVLLEIHNGLFRKRLISFGGLFKDIKKELSLDDIEKTTDLINVSDKEKHIIQCPDCRQKLIDHLYKFKHGFYIG